MISSLRAATRVATSTAPHKFLRPVVGVAACATTTTITSRIFPNTPLVRNGNTTNIRMFATSSPESSESSSAVLMPDNVVKKRLEEFQELFVEARYCIEDCVDSAETTYFDEEAETAQEAVNAAVESFDSLIRDMEDPDQKNGILRSNGLKVEQLKGEMHMAMNGGH